MCNVVKYLEEIYLCRVLKFWHSGSAGVDKFRTYVGLLEQNVMKPLYIKDGHGKKSLLWTHRNLKSQKVVYNSGVHTKRKDKWTLGRGKSNHK